MELIRLSPRTGDALTRLNVFEGQILHGRIYRAEPLEQAGTSGSGTNLVKIALGSHLIEAIVSKPLPEGSHVVLEVLKLGDETLVLKLLSVESESQSGTGGSVESQKLSSMVSAKPDIAELSFEAQGAVNQASSRYLPPQESQSTRLVESPDWTALPKPLISMVRTAIAEGFIDPATFAARVPPAKTAIQAAVEDFQSAVLKNAIPQSSTAQVAASIKQTVESIQTLAGILRPIVASMPSGGVSVEESVAQIAKGLSELSATLQPSLTGTASETTLSSKSDIVTSPSPAAQAQPSDQPAAQTVPVAHEGSPQKAGPGSETMQPPGTTPSAPTAPAAASNVSDAVKVIQGNLQPAIDQENISSEESGTAVASKQDASEVESDASQRAQAQPTRELLFGLRTLSLLAERLASMRGWTVEQAAGFRAHASHLTTLSDAWEGTILAPMLARSLDVPDAVPRLILQLLFPGGAAEFGVLKPERSGEDAGREDAETPDEGEEEYIGIIRLTTEGLGHLSVRLDFTETGDGDIVSGRFNVERDASIAIRAGIPSLERALDARGIESAGFRVVQLADELNSTQTTESNKAVRLRKTDSNGSLDIKI
jgi:hypothetical protein